MLDTLRQDLRLALRQLRRSPGFTVVAVLTLALGIGANTAIFSVVDSELLHPLPYAGSDRLLDVSSMALLRGGGGGARARGAVSYPDLQDLRNLTGDFSGVAAYASQRYNLALRDRASEVRAGVVSSDLFGLLGVSPTVGRTFTATERDDQLAVLSYGMWATDFGSDPGIAGRSVNLDGRSFTVVGVMPRGFAFPDDNVQLWVPLGEALRSDPQLEFNRHMYFFRSVARLAPGATLARARADAEGLARHIEEGERAGPRGEGPASPGARPQGAGATSPGARPQGGAGTGPRSRPQAGENAVPAGRPPTGPPSGGGRRVEVRVAGGGGAPGPVMVRGTHFDLEPLSDAVIGDARPALLILFGAVALVLLIACANAAGLLVARATERRKEMAVRRALGADRGRLIRQLLTESVLLALIAGAVGVLLAYWGLGAALATWRDLPNASRIQIDRVVLGFALGLSVVTGLAFGALPALRTTAFGVDEALRDEGTASTGSRRRRRTQSALVVTEIALALVLVVGSGLLVRSFVRLMSVNPGYDTRDVLAARIRLTPSRYPSIEQQKRFFESLTESLARDPAVADVSVSRTLPLSGGIQAMAFDPRQIRPDAPQELMVARVSVVGARYFTATGIGVQGREFAPTDRADARKVVIVNRRLADQLWPGEDPVGKTLPVQAPGIGRYEATVIGVIGDIHYASLEAPVMPEIYLPELQAGDASQLWVVLKARRAPLSLGGAVRAAVQRLDPSQPIGEIVSLDQELARSTSSRRLDMSLLTLFAGLALLLAIVGIYGITAYAVAQRTRELGLRMAIGARPGQVVALLLRENVALVVVGLGLGLIGAAAGTRVLGSMLFGVTTLDPVTFSGAAVLLASVAVVATWLPARRAARIDPMEALRHE